MATSQVAVDQEGRGAADWGAVFRAPPSDLTHPVEADGTRGHEFDRAAVDTIMAGIYARGDRLMVRFLLAHMAVALLLALHFQTWIATAAIGGAAVLGFSVTARLFPRTFLTRCVAGLALQTFVALHIYQLHGLAEMHFFFFTGFTMMLVYQDALSMWPGCIAIILQHIVFAWLHNDGVPLHFFEVPHISVTRLFYHFGIAIVQVAICGAWAHLLRRQTLHDAWQKTRLREAGVLAADQLERIRSSEAALRDAWERQRAILDNIPDLAWVQDLEGRYVAVNGAFARAMNLDVDAIVARSADEIFGADIARRYRAENRRVVSAREPRRVEENFVDGRGAAVEMETIRGPVYDRERRIVGTIGIARDITERKRADRERRDLELKMQEAQKLESLGVLAGGIAHDFNNLLVGVLGNATLARAEAPGGTPLAGLLDDIRTAAERAADLTRQMLAYAGRGQVVMGPVDLGAVVSEMARLLRSAISKRAELRLSLGERLPAVHADATQVRQVLMNLLTNASEALDDRPGTIAVSTRLVGPGESPAPGLLGSCPDPEGRYVALTVRDTGHGMDQATLGRIFDPFFTTKFTGRGLGLSAVQGIVRAHAAVLRVETAPGQGTTFEVLWPVSVETASAAAPPAGETDCARGRRILVIDDDEAVRRTSARILERAGYQVTEAESGEAGLALVRSAEVPFEGLLVDLTMPGMDGTRTLAEIRAVTPAIKAVMVSGYHEIDLPESVRAGTDGFLAKPYRHADLLGLMARVFGDG